MGVISDEKLKETLTCSGNENSIILPLELIWSPKGDITSFELSQCMPYIGKISIMPHLIDLEEPYLRHFKIINHNKNG